MPAADLAEDGLFARAPGVIDVRVGAVLVLHDPAGDRYLRLNASAELVWAQLAQPTRLRELADWLRAYYDLRPEQALLDVERLIVALAERGLVEDAGYAG